MQSNNELDSLVNLLQKIKTIINNYKYKLDIWNTISTYVFGYLGEDEDHITKDSLSRIKSDYESLSKSYFSLTDSVMVKSTKIIEILNNNNNLKIYPNQTPELNKLICIIYFLRCCHVYINSDNSIDPTDELYKILYIKIN